MLRERLNQLFNAYDPAIQSLISQVLTLEQAHISMDKPHLKNEIDAIISQLAAKEVDRLNKGGDESRSLFE